MGNMAMSLANIKGILQVGKVGVAKSCTLVPSLSIGQKWQLCWELAGHEARTWLLSLARAKALVFD
jgi:hypothetical protein